MCYKLEMDRICESRLEVFGLIQLREFGGILVMAEGYNFGGIVGLQKISPWSGMLWALCQMKFY